MQPAIEATAPQPELEYVSTMFVSPVMQIEKGWIDYNGHLNMAYYNVLFDRAGDDAFEKIGLGAEYARTRALTSYSAEVHVCYVRELHFGHSVTATFQLLDHDEKRMRFYQELRHVHGWLARCREPVDRVEVAAFRPVS